MSMAERIERWIYQVLNPVVKVLLRSPMHGVASNNVALLHFRGRKSGREFVTPLSYVREDGTRVEGHYRTHPDGEAWNNLRGR